MTDLHYYPTVANTKIPLRGTHGYKDATNNQDDLENWLSRGYNIGIALAQSGLMCLDLDQHSADGRKSLLDWKHQGFDLPPTYCEATPGNGVHFFYQYNGTHKRRQAVKPGLDLLADFTMISPSIIDGKPYRPLDGKRIEEAAPAPQWLLNLLDYHQPVSRSDYVPIKKYTGRLLDELVTGATVGNRNNWLTQITGKMIAVGAEPESVLTLLEFANGQLQPPLKQNDVEIIFKSVLRRETEKIKRGG